MASDSAGIITAIGLVLAAEPGLSAGPGRLAGLRRRWLQSEPAIGFGDAISIGAATGFLFGALEVIVKTLKYLYDGVFFEWSNPDAIWMIPTAEAALFGLVAAGIWVFAAAPRGRLRLFPLVMALATLGAMSVLVSLKRSGIHPIAEWALALGVGYQVARFASRRVETLTRRARWMNVALGGAALALALWLHPISRMRERAAIGAASPATPVAQSLPNVVIIVLDTVRAVSLQLYGYARPTTPHLVRFAERGVVFEQAVATSPWTMPSHASLFTGRWFTELSTDWLVPLDDTYATLAETLAAHGYVTGGFVANLLYTTKATGLGRGFSTYRDHPLTVQTWLESAEVVRALTRQVRRLVPGGWQLFDRKFASDVNSEFLDWLNVVGDRPFFAFLNYFDAHEPYELFEPQLDRLGVPAPDSIIIGPGMKRALESGEREVLDRYDSSIAYLDDAIGEVLAALEARGELDETLVIVTSDHGEQFFEHGLEGHSNSLYGPLLMVPLVAVLPDRVPEAVRIAAPVSIRDVPATVVDLLGLGDTTVFGDRSLRRMWDAESGAEPQLSEVNPYSLQDFDGPVVRGPMKSIVLDNLHYILNGDGVEELYDTRRDPAEVDDLVGTQRGDTLLPIVRSALDRVRESGRFLPATWSVHDRR